MCFGNFHHRLTSAVVFKRFFCSVIASEDTAICWATALLVAPVCHPSIKDGMHDSRMNSRGDNLREVQQSLVHSPGVDPWLPSNSVWNVVPSLEFVPNALRAIRNIILLDGDRHLFLEASLNFGQIVINQVHHILARDALNDINGIDAPRFKITHVLN